MLSRFCYSNLTWENGGLGLASTITLVLQANRLVGFCLYDGETGHKSVYIYSLKILWEFTLHILCINKRIFANALILLFQSKCCQELVELDVCYFNLHSHFARWPKNILHLALFSVERVYGKRAKKMSKSYMLESFFVRNEQHKTSIILASLNKMFH